MGKRSSFERNPRDLYLTPPPAVAPLVPYLNPRAKFYEPCAANGRLMRTLEFFLPCAGASDICPMTNIVDKIDARNLTVDDLNGADMIITNTPWERKLLHEMLEHFRTLVPSWILLDAAYGYTQQSKGFMDYCAKIVAVGRVCWIPDTKMSGKDDCAWYLFEQQKCETIFHGRQSKTR